MIRKIVFNSLVYCSFSLVAQDHIKTHDILIYYTPNTEFVFPTSKIVNSQTTETNRKNFLSVNLTQRFDNTFNSSIKNPLNTAAHNLFGLGNISDIRFGIDFGITNYLTLGLGRSKYNEMFDGTVKWAILSQTKANRPVSISFYGNIGYSTMSTEKLYAGVVPIKKNEFHRLQYCSQLLVARKVNEKLSLQMMPTYVHRNFIKLDVNTNNFSEDKNGLFSMGLAARLKLSKKATFVFDYFYNVSEFQNKNPLGYYNAFGAGLELTVRGRVFNVNFTNSDAILESNFMPNTRSNWLKGQFKLGFNISKWFIL
jgi:hypothetical protein